MSNRMVGAAIVATAALAVAAEAQQVSDQWQFRASVYGWLPDIGERFVPYYVDIGTGQIDLTWQAVTGLGYAFKWGDVFVLWRYPDYNVKSSSNIEDVNFSGPALHC